MENHIIDIIDPWWGCPVCGEHNDYNEDECRNCDYIRIDE